MAIPARVHRIIPVLVVLAACTTRSPAPASPETPPSSEASATDDPVTWRPGDAPAEAGEVLRWQQSEPDESGMLPVTWTVQIRNRCGQPAAFAVGPEVEAPPADAPLNTLAPGGAIEVGISGDEYVYLRDPTGAFSLRQGPTKTMVFMGEGSCDRIATDEDDG